MNFSISKYSYTPLAVLFGLFIICFIFNGFSIVLFLLILFTLFLYRVSKSEPVCLDKKAILSPLDGNIVSIENVEHPDLGKCIELSIENSFYQQGSIRACTDMDIEEVKLRHGLFLGADSKFKRYSQRAFMLSRNSFNQAFGLRIFAGYFDRSLKINDKSSFKAGDELAFSINSTLTLILPRETRLVVGVNDSVKASSLLAYFP